MVCGILNIMDVDVSITKHFVVWSQIKENTTGFNILYSNMHFTLNVPT